jgi:hypothetical protein
VLLQSEPAVAQALLVQLLDELIGLRQKVAALETFESERDSIEIELKGTRQRLQYLLAVSPAIIYTTQASGSYGRTFVSENLREIMGIRLRR